jgi:type I restriction enzyme S subunit
MQKQSRPPHVNDGIVTAFRDGQVTLRANRRTEGFTEAIQEIGYQGIRTGDLVVHSMDGFAGAIGVSDSDGKASPVVHAYQVNNDVDSRFIAYFLRSMAISGYIESLAKGIRERSTSFDGATLANLEIPCPPLDDQRRVANFLDLETSRIDTLRRIRERQKLLITERNKALLVHLTNENDWQHTPVRRLMSKLSRPVRAGDTVVTAYRDGEVTLRSNRREDGYTFSDKEAGYQGVEPGDLVFHALDGFAGAVGVSDSHGKASPVYHVCRMVGADDPRFIGFALRSMGMTGYLELQAGNVRQRSVDFRSWDKFGQLSISRPPVDAQRRIADEIIENRAWANRIIAAIDRQIALLTERRQALITAAVTGGITV